MKKKRGYRRRNSIALDLPSRANRVLYCILFSLLIILGRIWYLAVVQSDEKAELAAKPRKKVVVEPAKRGTIRDRFNIPLAVNKVKYQAAVYYSHLKDIPSVVWESDETGKKRKKFQRKEYTKALAEKLAFELGLDPERVEDQIYSKAVFFQNVPFVLKEDLTEREYYRIKMLEKDWPGLAAQKVAKRSYPLGRVGAEIIGYIGAMNREEYQKNLEELSRLKELVGGEDLEEGEIGQAKERIRELQEKAYTINDHIGKMGVEASFEELLRGSYGKKIYYADAKGNYLHSLPGGSSPRSGGRLLLSISSELQAFAEELLIKREGAHGNFFLKSERVAPTATGVSHPFIRGGAIVALEPKTGQVLALASYPRFDPNDFVSSGDPETEKRRQHSIQKWYESPSYIGMVWDQVLPLEKEVWEGKAVDERFILTFERYLDFLLPPEHQVRKGLQNIGNVRGAVDFQRQFDVLASYADKEHLIVLLDLLYKGEEDEPFYENHEKEVVEFVQGQIEQHRKEIEGVKRGLAPYFSGVGENYNKLFLLDLCRIVVQHEFFDEPLLQAIGKYSLGHYRDITAAYVDVSHVVQGLLKPVYHEHHFKKWKGAHQKQFLKVKRQEEQEKGWWARPYLDYLDQVEGEQYNAFWERNRHRLVETFLTGVGGEGELAPYSEFLRVWYRELRQGAHRGIPWIHHYDALQGELAGKPTEIVRTMRSYDELDRPLVGRYRSLRGDPYRPLEKDLAAAFYPRWGNGFCRSHAFRQATVQGSIFKLVTGYEALVQRYYDGVPIANLNPITIVDQVKKEGKSWRIGYWANGKPIPRIYKGGRVPKSLSKNIGEVDIVGALEWSSNPYFAILAGDFLKEPQDLMQAATLFSYGKKTGIDLPGEFEGVLPTNLATDRTNLYSSSIGQGTMVVTPLQTAVMLETLASGGDVLKPQIALLQAKSGHQGGEFAYQAGLAAAGIDFPLFSLKLGEAGIVQAVNPEVLREIDLPDPVRELLYHGMRRVVDHVKASNLAPIYEDYPDLIQTLKEMKGYIIGKTSSSESMVRVSLDRKNGVKKLTHGWYGGIIFDHSHADLPDEALPFSAYGEPELVVIVYLPHAVGGKDTLPLVAAMGKKWREITKNK